MPTPALRNAPVLHEDENLQVKWLEEHCATFNTWTGFLQGDAYRKRMDLCLELLTRVEAHAILANVQQFRPILAADQDWSNDDWAPRAVSAGLQRMVVVLPHNVFSQLAVSRVVQRLDESPIRLAQVAEVSDAVRWLELPSNS